MILLVNYIKDFKDLKVLVLFFIFATSYCHCHSNNRSICKSLKGLEGNNHSSFTRRNIYYGCSHKARRVYNPYAVVAKDILRKYLYIVNVVVIYIILYSL
jgi:hypothetical protein